MTGESKLCVVKGCNRHAASKGLCHKHYKAERLYGVLADERKYDMDEICSIEDCGKLKTAEGMCARHYQRVLRNGDPLEEKKRGRHGYDNFSVDFREDSFEVPDVIQERMGRDWE